MRKSQEDKKEHLSQSMNGSKKYVYPKNLIGKFIQPKILKTSNISTDEAPVNLRYKDDLTPGPSGSLRNLLREMHDKNNISFMD